MLRCDRADKLPSVIEQGYKCLNLGCNKRIVKGAVNLDIEKFKGIDVVHDITKKLPFKNNTFDFILAENILEHIPKDKIDNVMRDLGRVLKKGGILFIGSPHFTSSSFFMNDHYLNFGSTWTIRDYVTNPFRKDAIYAYKKTGLKLVKTKIFFGRTMGRWIFNVPYELLVNISDYSRSFYEESVIRINPALGMFFWLEKVE